MGLGMRALTVLTALLLTTVVHRAQAQGDVEHLKKVIEQLSRQMMLMQLYNEEQTRSYGDSGVKQVRVRRDGTKPYFVPNWASDKSVSAIHDHTDLIRTLGMGEVVAVLNGLEFRTRHNDYKLRMPSTTSGEYHETEDIPYPDVPPEVTRLHSVPEQIKEMREWFKAWRDSDVTHRDYRRYFRPNLCYMEGAWTSDLDLDEPFDSDRHQLEANSWFELQEQIRFTSYTGDKSLLENYAYLPTTVMSMNNGTPVFGQWNYRILCHPIKGDLPLSYLKPIDNLAVRLSSQETFDEYVNSRSARFHINPTEEDTGFTTTVLDELMSQIPGKDNYRANITDTVFGHLKYTLGSEESLNTGYYNRWYRVRKEGAMGSKVIHRGYSDRNFFVAETTQTRVAPMMVELCRNRQNRKKRRCNTVAKRVSYAIPLEIMYTTPLHNWNPYNIIYKGDAKSKEGQTVRAEGRNGGKTPGKALNGSNSKDFYHTPYLFFSGSEVDAGSADTARGAVGILDNTGTVRFLKASGIRIQTPEIEGVGIMRTRYPIAPVHAEGSPIWKEVEALRDMVMDMQKYARYFLQPPSGISVNATDSGGERPVRLATSLSKSAGQHFHEFELTSDQVSFLKKRAGRRLNVTTDDRNGHSHTLRIMFDNDLKKFAFDRCDSQLKCWDGHNRILQIIRIH